MNTNTYTPRPDEYTAIAVWPNRLEIAHMRLETITGSGTRYHVAQSRFVYRTWPDLLRRRKPWQQPGPVFIYGLDRTGQAITEERNQS